MKLRISVCDDETGEILMIERVDIAETAKNIEKARKNDGDSRTAWRLALIGDHFGSMIADEINAALARFGK